MENYQYTQESFDLSKGFESPWEYEEKREKRSILTEADLVLAIVSAMIIIGGLLISIIFVDFTILNFIIALTILAIFYLLLLIYLVTLNAPEEIEKTRIIEKPVIKEIIKEIEKPIYKEVVRTVEKPVYKEIIKEVEKPVYVVRPKTASLKIPKYEYVGSSETKTYHKRNCRFSKLIKRKYKVSNDSKYYFARNDYNACKICL